MTAGSVSGQASTDFGRRLKYGLIGLSMFATTAGVSTRPDAEIIGVETLSGSWFSCSLDTPAKHVHSIRPIGSLDSGESLDLDVQEVSPSELVKALHKESGLTWDQLGRLFGVSRRAVHHWASGGRLNAANQELLGHLIHVVRDLPGTNPAEKRASLLKPGSDGLSLFDSIRSSHASSGGDINRPPFRPEQMV